MCPPRVLSPGPRLLRVPTLQLRCISRSSAYGGNTPQPVAICRMLASATGALLRACCATWARISVSARTVDSEFNRVSRRKRKAVKTSAHMIPRCCAAYKLFWGKRLRRCSTSSVEAHCATTYTCTLGGAQRCIPQRFYLCISVGARHERPHAPSKARGGRNRGATRGAAAHADTTPAVDPAAAPAHSQRGWRRFVESARR